MRKLPLFPDVLNTLVYQKTGESESTTRVVIPTYIPAPKHANVKAIDVTDLSDEQREELAVAWGEYQNYLDQQRETLFAFDDFVEHTGRELPDIKWRTFKPDNIR